jgi:hypothetical protein
MEHILLQCDGSHQNKLWQLMREIWPARYGPCPTITLGTILGCGSLGASPSKGKPTKEVATKIAEEKAERRLLRILISETAYLIWLLRCEAVVGERNSSGDAVRTRWKAQIVERRMTDYLTATRLSRSKAFTKALHNTWKYVQIRGEKGQQQPQSQNTDENREASRQTRPNITRTGEYEVFSG